MNQVANTVMIPREEYDALVQQRDALQHQLSGMTDSAKHFSKGMEYYRDLIDEAAKSIGIAMYTADDQGVHPDPLRAKLPECVAELVQQRDELLALLPQRTAGGFVAFGKYYAEQERVFAPPNDTMAKFKHKYLDQCEAAIAKVKP